MLRPMSELAVSPHWPSNEAIPDDIVARMRMREDATR